MKNGRPSVIEHTVQTADIWLEELCEILGPGHTMAWKVLSTVLHKLRDRLPLPLAAHLGAQLPLLIRGVYYDQFKPERLPVLCDYDAFVEEVDEWLSDTRPVHPEDAIAAVFALLSRHIPTGQIDKVKAALPGAFKDVWRAAEQEINAVSGNGNGRHSLLVVKDLMSRDVATAYPQETLEDAARIMAELDIGILPVSENDRLIGMITDRDIAVHGIAEGKGPTALVRDVMSPEVKYCFADQSLDEVVDNMADIQLRRLPVLNRGKRLVGILSLGDIATSDNPWQAAKALHGISQPVSERDYQLLHDNFS